MPAEDSTRWTLTYVLALFALYYVSITGSQLLVTTVTGLARPTLTGLFIQLAIMLPITVVFAYLFVVLVPRPMPVASISPLGLRLHLPLGPRSVPWSRVALIGHRVYAFSGRGIMTHVFRASPYQLSRLALFAPRSG